MIAPARVAAYETLRAVAAGRADLPNALARARESLQDERDRALAGELAAGTLRWQAAFDHIVDAFVRRPDRLDPEVRIILRLTLYQLLHLERIPASAAVNDAVDLTRRAHKGSAGTLVNAVSRRASRERRKLPLPPRPVDGSDRAAALDYLSVTLSHPRWLVARWLDRHGFEAAEAWARFDNDAPGLTLRANTLRIDRERLAARLADAGVTTRPTPFAPDGLAVTAGNPLLTPLAKEGLFVVQEEAAQLVPLLAAAAPGERVLDACASPGGKTLAMAASMEDRGLIVAADVRERRVALLARTIDASGATIVRIVQADAVAPAVAAAMDCVLLDAPCSGLGTLRRDPDIKWRRTEDELRALHRSQVEMLERTAEVVKPGGRLVYATCSSEPEENEEVVRAFLARGTFRPDPEPRVPASVRPLLGPEGHLRTLPHRDGLEAFFAAVVVKKESLR